MSVTPVDPHFLSGSGGGDYHGETPCPVCGYDLRGLPIGTTCPECGAEPRLDDGFDESSDAVIDPRFVIDPDTSDRHAGAAEVADPDPRCKACGYVLKGLPAAGRCPECGLEFHSERKRMPLRSDLMPIEVTSSVRWRWGLLLLIASTAGYIGFGIWGLFPSDLLIYELGTTVSLAAWGVGCRLAIPRSLCGGGTRWERCRTAACATQFLWTPLYLLVWRMDATGSSGWLGISAVPGILALVGLIVVLVLLCRIAGELYFRDIAKLLGHMVWIAIPVAVIDWWFPWPAPGGDPLFGARFGVVGTVVLFATLLPLFIVPLVVCVACLQFFNFSLWSARQSRRGAGREDRIRDRKSELQEEAVDERPRIECCDDCGAMLVGGSCPACGSADPPADIPLA